MSELTIQRLGAGTLFKLLLIGYATVTIPAAILAGVLSMFGYQTVFWDGQAVTGFDGLLASLLGGPFLTLAWTILSWGVVALGLWIYSQFRSLVIKYCPTP